MRDTYSDYLYRPRLSNHTVIKRVIILALIGILIGSGGAFGAIVLLHLLSSMTNIFWYHHFSFAEHLMPSLAGALYILATPVI